MKQGMLQHTFIQINVTIKPATLDTNLKFFDRLQEKVDRKPPSVRCIKDLLLQDIQSETKNGVAQIVVNESEPTDQDIERWFAEARYEELERLVLDGKTNLIFKYSNKYLQMANFLENVQKNE
uniref:Uncharacterized protein n=1 Tax=Romanomermis culicivorax TaxID=13658 RepID=A0A915IVF4_ROMCU